MNKSIIRNFNKLPIPVNSLWGWESNKIMLISFGGKSKLSKDVRKIQKNRVRGIGEDGTGCPTRYPVYYKNRAVE